MTDWVPLVVSVLSLGLASVSTWVSVQARRDARRSATEALWANAIEAVAMLGVDPTSEPLADRLIASRVRLMALVDGLEWDGVGEWLAAEQRLGSAVGREVMESFRVPPATADEHLQRLHPFLDWNMALTANLRHLRDTGEDRKSLAKLTDSAESRATAIHNKHGWPLPKNPLEPLD